MFLSSSYTMFVSIASLLLLRTYPSSLSSSHHMTSHHITLQQIMRYHIMSHHITLSHIKLYHITSQAVDVAQRTGLDIARQRLHQTAIDILRASKNTSSAIMNTASAAAGMNQYMVRYSVVVRAYVLHSCSSPCSSLTWLCIEGGTVRVMLIWQVLWCVVQCYVGKWCAVWCWDVVCCVMLGCGVLWYGVVCCECRTNLIVSYSFCSSSLLALSTYIMMFTHILYSHHHASHISCCLTLWGLSKLSSLTSLYPVSHRILPY